LLARGLLVGLALAILVAPAAVADDPARRGSQGTAVPRMSGGGGEALLWMETARTRRILATAVRYRSVARYWRALMSRPRPQLGHRARPFDTLLAKRRWQARRWYAKAVRARSAGQRPPHLAAWRCIHRWEGPWDDPNAPYYGGLQMDLAFQRTYAARLLRRRGTADHWRPLAQMWVAERALRAGRGFYPWPVAARRCGLI
jgi:hypothetical protein